MDNGYILTDQDVAELERRRKKARLSGVSLDVADNQFALELEKQIPGINKGNETAKAQAEKEIQESIKSKASERVKYKSLMERIGDAFEADSPQDKQKRKDAGQPELFKDQQAKKKEPLGGMSSEDMQKRQEFYSRQGIDIYQAQADKDAYDKFKDTFKGQSLAKLTLEGKITDDIKRYEHDKDKISKIEQDYINSEKQKTEKYGALESASRGATREVGRLAKVPNDLRAIAGGFLDVFSPEGSRVDKFAQDQYNQAVKGREGIEQQIIDQGYAQVEGENKIASDLGGGAASLLTSIGVNKAGGMKAVTGLFGTRQGAEQLVESKEAGVGDLQALATGITAGVIEAGLEKLGLEKYLGVGGEAVQQLGKGFAIEAGQEFAQSISQSGINQTYRDVDWGDAFKQALYEGGIGGVVGGGGHFTMALSKELQSRGVDQEDALELSMDATSRSRAILKDLSAGDEEMVAQDLDDAGVPEKHPDLDEESIIEQKLNEAGVPDVAPTTPTDTAVPPVTDEEALLEQELDQAGVPRVDTGQPPVAGVPATEEDQIEQGLNEAGVPEATVPTDASGLDEETRIEQQLDQAGVPRATEDVDVEEVKKAGLPTETPGGIPITYQRGSASQEVASAEDAAKDMIESYVKRGDTVQQIKAGGLGVSNDRYHASIGGYSKGKKVNPDEIVVTKLNGKEVSEKFKLQNVYDSISAQAVTVSPKTGKKTVTIKYPESKDLPSAVQQKMGGRYQNETQERIKKNKPSKGDQERAGVGGWDKTNIVKLVKEFPELRKNPVLTARKGSSKYTDKYGTPRNTDESTYFLDYKSPDGKQSFSLNMNEMGLDVERLENAGVRTGTKVNLKDALQGKGKIPAIVVGKTSKGKDVLGMAMPSQEIRKQAISTMRQDLIQRKTPEELAKLADLLNKAAQGSAILRRGQYKSTKHAGVFEHGKETGDHVVKLQDAVIKDPKLLPNVLAHELSHAIEFNINGNNSSTYKLFGELTKDEETQITKELKQIVEHIEGTEQIKTDPAYYNKPTEMLARYVETLILEPNIAHKVAPTVSEKWDALVIREQQVADLVFAIQGQLDKNANQHVARFYQDLRQTYIRVLGKHSGTKAYNREVIRRANIQLSATKIKKLLNRKFKDIKDSPEDLYRAVEGVLATKGGVPTFGTHDFQLAKTEAELEGFKQTGYAVIEEKAVPDGDKTKPEWVMSKQRYTEAQGREMFEKLSPKGQQLIKDFTTAKEETKEEFNRGMIKEAYKIEGNVEGWVKHIFEQKQPYAGNKHTTLKAKVAGSRKQRKNVEGAIEDFRKSMEVALIELEVERIDNAFIVEQLANISKPIATGQKPDKGWTEVIADEKGIRLPGMGLKKIVNLENGRSFYVPGKKYQVPTVLVKHYGNTINLTEEADKVSKTLASMGTYWGINVLTSSGATPSTNAIGGGIQYATKVMNDFYLDIFTANFEMSRTIANVAAPFKALTPKGWTQAPDWHYGGYRSTLAGQFASNNTDTPADRRMHKIGNKALWLFSTIDRYFKTTIALAEGVDLSGVEKRKLWEGLNKQEEEIIANANAFIDMYGYDYDNVPIGLETFDRKTGKMIKPFLTYLYKYSKQVTTLVAKPFDKSLTWQERAAAAATLGTIIALINKWLDDQEEKQQTPEGDTKTPPELSPLGRVLIGTDNEGRELFTRIAKYPFVNLTSAGRNILTGHAGQAGDIMTDMFGTIGPGADLLLILTGRSTKYDQYKELPAKLGDWSGSFIPGFRVLGDIGNLIDPTARKQDTFIQGLFSTLPVWGSDKLRETLRGKPRTIDIPDEPKEGRSINDKSSTTKVIERERSDILLGALTGVYTKRINPTEARMQELRQIRNAAEVKIRKLLEEGKEADALAIGAEYGLTIPESSLKYYQNKAKKASGDNSRAPVGGGFLQTTEDDETPMFINNDGSAISPRSNRGKAFKKAKLDYGWGDDEIGALDSLINGESGWRSTARNSSSGAYGLFQFMPMHWGEGKYLPSGDQASVDEQVDAGLRYIRDRYGSPRNAWSFWQSQSPHWY